MKNKTVSSIEHAMMIGDDAEGQTLGISLRLAEIDSITLPRKIAADDSGVNPPKRRSAIPTYINACTMNEMTNVENIDNTGNVPNAIEDIAVVAHIAKSEKRKDKRTVLSFLLNPLLYFSFSRIISTDTSIPNVAMTESHRPISKTE